jgi:DNA-binding NtrC family response regulator
MSGGACLSSGIADLTVLLAEDEDSIRWLASRALTGAGFHVIEAADGEEAFRLAQEHEFAVLVTDIIMPKLSGVELAERLKALRPELKVLFISGYVEAHLVSSAMPDAKLLHKPFGVNALVSRVQEMFATPSR